MKENSLYKIEDWITDKVKRGKYTFSRQELAVHFLFYQNKL
jgi:hypothetical protein